MESVHYECARWAIITLVMLSPGGGRGGLHTREARGPIEPMVALRME